MGLEEAIQSIKEVFPVWKPWKYNQRKKALARLESIAEKYRDDVSSLDFIGHAVRIGAVNEERRWGRALDYTFNRLVAYDAIDPSILGTFGQDRDSIGLYNADPLSSEVLPELLEGYKAEFGREAMFGLLEGLRSVHKRENEKQYQSSKVFEEDTLEIFQRKEIKPVLEHAKECGQDVLYAMTRAIGESFGSSPYHAQFPHYDTHHKKYIDLLIGEEAKKVYESYKDSGRNILSYVLGDMVNIALHSFHQFSGVTHRWQRPEVREAFTEAAKYGGSVEDIIFTAIDRAERYAPLGSKEFSFLSTDEFKNLLTHYHANIPGLEKIVETVAGGDRAHRLPKMHVFLQPEVQDLFAQKERDQKQVEAMVHAFSNRICYYRDEVYHYRDRDKYIGMDKNMVSAMCVYFQTEDATKIDAVMKTVQALEETGLFKKMRKKEVSLKEIEETTTFIGEQGFIPTSYLVAELYCAKNYDGKDKATTVNEWKQTVSSFSTGNFDATSELHRNLEYTRFRQFVDHEKVKKYIKNNFTYGNYQEIFANPSAQEQALSPQDAFEVACVAHEAKKLYDYILQVKQRADQQGRKVVVVPNFSYGYLPVAPLVSHLEAEGIEVLIGCKVGSSESHDNKEVMNSRLFKGKRRKFMDEQPVIIVVDGTQHLVDRGTEDTAARYPDAYQGYLNQVIAMNDANGLRREDYTAVGKTDEDMKKLRASEEFQRTVAVYTELAGNNKQKPYQFSLWNTAEVPLIIRNYRQKLAQILPVTPHQIQGPTMIFCNVGVLDEQIPQELKQQYSGLTHTPAYYDDSGRIIAFDYGFDNFGVRYLNRLETKVKEAFEAQNGNQRVSLNLAPAIMQYLSKARTCAIEEMSA